MEKDFQQTNALLYKLLFHTLLEIREEAIFIENKKIHKLSNLVHNLPMQLRNNRNPEELLNDLKADAKGMGIENWLNNVLSQL